VRAAQARQETLLFGRRRSPRHRGRIRPAGRALLRRLSVALARGPISPPLVALAAAPRLHPPPVATRQASWEILL